MRIPFVPLTIVALLSSLVAVTSSCAPAAGVSADSAAFTGLPRATVVEVLADPIQSKKIEAEPNATRDSLAQGIVRDFILCREEYAAYRSWTTTGVRPSAAPLSTPAHALEPSNAAMETDYEHYKADLASGDPDNLKFTLATNGGCGYEIPVKPGDVSGPTIQDALEGDQ